ncbi:hypothetical protein STEG23_035858, partial [Scotinomys teguina]
MARKAGQGKEEEESRARQQEEKTPVRDEEKKPACHGRGHHVVEQEHVAAVPYIMRTSHRARGSGALHHADITQSTRQRCPTSCGYHTDITQSARQRRARCSGARIMRTSHRARAAVPHHVTSHGRHAERIGSGNSYINTTKVIGLMEICLQEQLKTQTVYVSISVFLCCPILRFEDFNGSLSEMEETPDTCLKTPAFGDTTELPVGLHLTCHTYFTGYISEFFNEHPAISLIPQVQIHSSNTYLKYFTYFLFFWRDFAA